MSNNKNINPHNVQPKYLPKKLLAASVALAINFLPVSGVFAQMHDQDRTSVIEEIVVEARRVQESQQDVPLAITALSGDYVDNLSITTANDLTGRVPTLSVQRGGLGGNPNFSLRGIRSGVTSYFAEIPVDTSDIDLQLWDLASIQAITGPQGTLFGKNSTGGAILFMPNAPTDEFEGHVKASFGNYNSKQLEAVVNVPISDTLKFRFGTQLNERDGLVENISGPDLNDMDRQAYRLSVAFTPSDSLENVLVLSYNKYDEKQVVQINQSGPIASNPRGYAYLSYLDFSNFPDVMSEYTSALAEQDQRGQRSSDVPYPHYEKAHRFNLSNILTAEIGDVTARYITGYSESKTKIFTSSSSLPLPIVVGGTELKNESFTQELQFIGALFDEKLEYQVGGFYSHVEEPLSDSSFIFLGRPSDMVINDPIDPLSAEIANSQYEETAKAVYGQVNYHVTNDLTLTAGLRYTRDNIKDVNTSKSAGDMCTLKDVPSVNLTTCIQTLETDFSAVTYNVSMDYKINQDLLIYFATRQGYNAGGHNINILGEDDIEYEPEEITDFELGLKADWSIGDVPIRTNIALYHSAYEDIQRRIVVLSPRPQEVTTNAAEATLYGGQLDLSVNVTPDFKLNLNYGYVHSEYDTFENPLVGNATGNQFAQAPEHTVNLSGSYHINLDELGELLLSANYQYISSQYSDDNNVGLSEAEIPGYGLFAARIDWLNVLGLGVDLALYGRNLNDKLYRYNTSISTTLGTVANIYGEPRLYGLEMKYNF